MRRMMVFLLVCSAAGCSAPDSMPGQVAIRTSPAGATCTVRRGDQTLGVVSPTPGSLAVTPSERGLVMTCTKPGWQTAVGTVDAVYKGIGFGQLLSGGAAAVVEDAAKGTDFRYDPAGLTLTLVPG